MSTSSPPPAPRLPTPRQLLTSLLTAISKIPLPEPQPAPTTSGPLTTTDGLTTSNRISTTSTNPLRHIHPSHRPLFTTLHVLFPPLLLPALDLLDRGLVTRLSKKPSGQRQQHPTHTHPVEYPDIGMPAAAAAAHAAPPSATAVYVVRSAQKQPSTRRGGDESAGDVASRRYVVHTVPWNCSCAAFAFAAFPAVRGSSEPSSIASEDEEGEERDGDTGSWDFGGLSFDGVGEGVGEGNVPPCCKHLLACVLAERWALGFGGYVNERVVSREKIAAIFADV